MQNRPERSKKSSTIVTVIKIPPKMTTIGSNGKPKMSSSHRNPSRLFMAP
jgi:hypothetical protein